MCIVGEDESAKTNDFGHRVNNLSTANKYVLYRRIFKRRKYVMLTVATNSQARTMVVVPFYFSKTCTIRDSDAINHNNMYTVL